MAAVEGAPAGRSRKLLDPSELGTKEYWEAAYDRELKNHDDDADDEGIIWFDESNAEDTVLDKLDQFGDPAERDLLDRTHSRFLDLGTGNGHMLFSLREHENDEGLRWTGQMIGVDYSPRSIQLARQIAARRRDALSEDPGETAEAETAVDKSCNEDVADIQFEVWDLLSQPPGGWAGDGFDVVLDKGTFDAISLMAADDAEATLNPCEQYREAVVPLIKRGKYLFITSCNWTKDELTDWLAPEGGELIVFDEARYPTFTFGGKTGQSVVTLVFQRR